MIDLPHVLYSPLTSIKGNTGSLLEPDTNSPEEVRQEFLRTINQAADRLNQAIKDLVLPTPQNISSQVAAQPETRLQDIFHQLDLGLLDPPKEVNVNFFCEAAFPPVFINPRVAERAIKYMVECVSAYTASPAELQVSATADHESATISVEFIKWPGQHSLASDDSDVDSD
jgi:K+-sensing histidine kinase KdpD